LMNAHGEIPNHHRYKMHIDHGLVHKTQLTQSYHTKRIIWSHMVQPLCFVCWPSWVQSSFFILVNIVSLHALS
jgi:hypothetical protein